ncbi:hypothetical protein DFH28DRAFT_907408 [Melampsora americana]|nr:hypothetical protein DFH28DRAFT_907408 [Melampsora americana]
MDIEIGPTQIPLPLSPPSQQSIDPFTILSIDISNDSISFDNEHNSISNLENHFETPIHLSNWTQPDSEISSCNANLASCLPAHSIDDQSNESNPDLKTLRPLDLDANTLNLQRNSQIKLSSSTPSPHSPNTTLSFQSNHSSTATISARTLTGSNPHTTPDCDESDLDSCFNQLSAASSLPCPILGNGSINGLHENSSMGEPADIEIDELYMLALDGTLDIDSHQSETTSNVTLNESNQSSSHSKLDSAHPTKSSTKSFDQSSTSNLVKPLRITKNIPAADINTLLLNSNRSSNTVSASKHPASGPSTTIADSHTFTNHDDHPHHLSTNCLVSIDSTNIALSPSPPLIPPPELPLVIDSHDGSRQTDLVHQTNHSTSLTSSGHNTLTTKIVNNPAPMVHERTLNTTPDLIQPSTFSKTYASPQSEPHISEFDSDSDSDSESIHPPEFESADSLPGLRRPRLRPPKVPEPKLNDLMDEKPIHSDHYCCFAIPLYNTGIYVILAQFTIFGFVTGVLAFAAPSVIAIAVPEALTAVMGVLCILVGFFQLMGFYGVYKERVKVFKLYLYINFGFVLITLGYSLVIMIMSAQQHQTAIEQCLLQFVSVDGNNTPSNESKGLCNIWTWAQLGVCGILWILFGMSELYFCFLQRRWSQDQKSDHLKYRSIISAVRESIAVRNSEEIERRSESNDEGSRGMNGVVKGGSRLKHEIEWKEIPSQPTEEQEITQFRSQDSNASSDAEFYRKSLHVRKRNDSTLSAPKSILKSSTSRSNLNSTVL